MKVSNNKLTCATEEPNKVGTMSFITRRISGCCQPQRGSTSKSNCASCGNWNSSCKMPAARIAQPIAMIGGWVNFEPHSAPAIMHRLRMIGVNAGQPKR